MKPFLFLSTRAEAEIAAQEVEAFTAQARSYGVPLRGPAEFRWHRLDQEPLPELDLEDFSGVILGGSPFNALDPEESKTKVQRRVEGELTELLGRIIEQDFPFLGACYGVGTLGARAGGVIDRQYGEPVGAVSVRLSPEGRRDELLADLPERFWAFVGHKEACSVLPDAAVLLASSASCPVQMFRIGSHVYATQFHPELDVAGLLLRIEAYRDHGYFPAEQYDAVRETVRENGGKVSEPGKILRNFVERYQRE